MNLNHQCCQCGNKNPHTNICPKHGKHCMHQMSNVCPPTCPINPFGLCKEHSPIEKILESFEVLTALGLENFSDALGG